MTAFDVTSRRLSFLRDFSARDRELAEKAAGQHEARQRKAHEARATQLEATLEDHRRRLHDLLGPRKSAELRDATRHERLAFRDAVQPPQGLSRDYEKQKRASRRKIQAVMRKLGATPERVAKIRDKHTANLREILGSAEIDATAGFHLPSNLDHWTKLSPLNKHPLTWGVEPVDDPNDPHRWFVEKPPWFGFLFRFAVDGSSNFQADRQHVLDPSAGLVGNEVTLDCNSADNSDEARATAETQIAFGFQTPVAGLVEVLIDAQSSIGRNYVKVEDEWGFSSAWAYQANYLMMNVLHPNVPEPSLALLSSPYIWPAGQAAYAHVSDGDDYLLDRESLTRGQHYFAQLLSSGPVPAGQSVVVTVGTRSVDFGSVDDMEYHSRTNFQWFISSVQVRIAP